MQRNLVSLTIAILFLILAVTGIMGFFLPFDLLIVSVHSLLGFLFIGAIILHLKNNFRQLKKYFQNWTALIITLLIAGLALIILWQPAPVKAVLGLSKNLGPVVDRFELKDDKITYTYSPANHYKMQLNFKGGKAFQPASPPYIAIWLENTSRFHLKTLYHTPQQDSSSILPYWSYKKSEYEKYKKRSEEYKERGKNLEEELDALSSATPNDSFDPADYIVPKDPEKESPYRLLIEINMPDDGNDYHKDQPSLVYAVEVDNRNPRSYQVLDLVGYPEAEKGEETLEWSLRYVDETITTAHDLYDSAMLLIERSDPSH